MDLNMNSEDKFKTIIIGYLLICGALSNDDIDEICKYNDLKVSKKARDSYLKELGLDYDGKFYSRYGFLIFDEFIKARDNYKIRLLSFDEIYTYTLYLGNLFSKLEEVVNDQISEFIFALAAMLRIFDDNIYHTELLNDKKRLIHFEHAKISKKDIKKISKIFSEYGDRLRYWCAYGRDDYDLDFDSIIEDTLLNEKPKEETLINCLNNLDFDGYENICDTYLGESESVEDLKDIILETMEESVKYFTKGKYNRFMNCNHKEFTYEFSDTDFMQGFVFAYDDNGVIKTLVPKEILDILKDVDINVLDDDEEFSLKKYGFESSSNTFDSYVKNLIIGYFEMNGVIEKTVLQKLLKKNHAVDMDIKDIDDIVEQLGAHFIHKKYYSIVSDEAIIKILQKIKEENGDYREFTPEISDVIFNYLDEIKNACNGDDELEYNVTVMSRLGGLDKEAMADLKDEFNLSKNTFNKIYDIVKKYKNTLPLWTCNGRVMQPNGTTVRNEKKIGRNEPCPCGSGKKYKKCCGR